MINIFEYYDYRQFLQDFYKHEKKTKPWFSYRYISAKVNLNPGYIVKVLQGKIHLGVKNATAFADLTGLMGKKRDYFTELLLFGRAKRQDEIEQRFERLQTIKGIKFRTIADSMSEFFSEWYHMALRSLISIHPFDGKNYRALASMLSPRITAKQVQDSLRLLERLEMVVRGDDGIYRVTEQFISTGDKWTSAVIRNYQKKNIELSIAALENISKELRDISSVTMTIPLKEIDLVRERIRLFRQEQLLMSQESKNDDTVMQLNIQLFPVAFCRKRGE
ncbi:MAG: TIGR02147 family protein [Chitinispirillaceae bacterium]|nr:TIGR02147 family protein [Chitinispirillaceae bacterium]